MDSHTGQRRRCKANHLASRIIGEQHAFARAFAHAFAHAFARAFAHAFARAFAHAFARASAHAFACAFAHAFLGAFAYVLPRVRLFEPPTAFVSNYIFGSLARSFFIYVCPSEDNGSRTASKLGAMPGLSAS